MSILLVGKLRLRDDVSSSSHSRSRGGNQNASHYITPGCLLKIFFLPFSFIFSPYYAPKP